MLTLLTSLTSWDDFWLCYDYIGIFYLTFSDTNDLIRLFVETLEDLLRDMNICFCSTIATVADHSVIVSCLRLVVVLEDSWAEQELLCWISKSRQRAIWLSAVRAACVIIVASSAGADLTTMTSAEAGRQDRSKCRQCEGEREGDNRNSQTRIFVSKLRRSLQYGTFKQVNHLIIKIIAIIIMVRRRKGPVVRGL